MDDEGNDELPPAEYLRDLVERMRHIPVMYGVDDYDISRLLNMAAVIESVLSSCD